MRNCFVPGCDRLHREAPKRMMFVAPKDKETFDAWTMALPKIRAFKPQDKVCERHFNEDDIRTTYDNVINGLVYKIERGRPRLRPKAVPCRNLEPYVVSQRSKNGRKPAKVNQLIQETTSEALATTPKKQIEYTEREEHLEIEEVNDLQEITSTAAEIEAEAEVEAENALSMEVEHLERIEIAQTSELYENMFDDIYEVVLPNTLWGVHRCPERTAFFFSYLDTALHRTSKMISISHPCRIKITLGNHVVSEYNLGDEVNSTESLSNLIAQVDKMKLCSRIFDNAFCELTAKDDATVCGVCSQLDQQSE